MKNKTVLISVIVCTYNRASLLKNCLQSLEKQTADNKNYEVIVVNNNSNDNTPQVVRDFTKSRLNIRMVKEKNQGLSYARNRGWKEAKGEYVAYIDDDALAEPDWIEQILAFIKNKPKVNVFGGPYNRFSLKPIPAWLPENYFTLNLGEKEKVLNLKNEWLSGSNMIFKKSILKQYDGFRTNLGMKGKQILYGEETEFLVRLGKTEEQGYYVLKIRVKHLVAEHKLHLWWLLKNDYWHSFSYSLLKRNRLDLLRGIVYLMKSLLIVPFYLFNNKKNPIKGRVYFALSGIFSSLGRIAGSMREVE